MELWLYVSRRSVKKGSLRWIWLKRCRWFLLKREGSERFKVVLEMLESRGCPMVPMGSSKDPDAYLVLKVGQVRDRLTLLVPDLLHYACLSEERIYSLEDGEWYYEQVKVSPRLWALYLVGLKTKSTGSFEEAKSLFSSLLEGDKREKVNEKRA
jgi:hypothetical protein